MKITQTFKQIALMDEFIREYLKEFAPAAYDTQVNIKIRQSYEMWQKNEMAYEVTIDRMESCD